MDNKIPVDYRTWVKSIKKMFPVVGFCFGDNVGDVEVEYPEKGQYRCWNSQKDECVVMQYTGRFIHDKKLYAGDILKITLEWNDEVHYVEIIHDKEACAFIVDVSFNECDYDISALGWALDQWLDENSNIELVGNIFEHPELLKNLEN